MGEFPGNSLQRIYQEKQNGNVVARAVLSRRGPKQSPHRWGLLRPDRSIRDGIAKNTPALVRLKPHGARESAPRNDMIINGEII